MAALSLFFCILDILAFELAELKLKVAWTGVSNFGVKVKLALVLEEFANGELEIDLPFPNTDLGILSGDLISEELFSLLVLRLLSVLKEVGFLSSK